MAEQHTKPEVSISKGLRQLKVGYVSILYEVRKDAGTARYSRCAGLRLKGKWLEEQGFTIDTPVEVRVLPGYLILNAQEAQPETAEAEVVVALRKACKKLSARKQRQIAEFIQVIATPQKRRPPPGTVEWQTRRRSK